MTLWLAGWQFVFATVSRGTEISQEGKRHSRKLLPRQVDSVQLVGVYGSCTYYCREVVFMHVCSFSVLQFARLRNNGLHPYASFAGRY